MPIVAFSARSDDPSEASVLNMMANSREARQIISRRLDGVIRDDQEHASMSRGTKAMQSLKRGPRDGELSTRNKRLRRVEGLRLNLFPWSPRQWPNFSWSNRQERFEGLAQDIADSKRSR